MTLSIGAPRARDLVSRFPDQHVLVVGDLMLDRFIVGNVARISPEAPVPVVRFRSEHVRLGGAANVAQNLRALGARVSLVGIVGDDSTGARLTKDLAAIEIAADGLVKDATRPTVEKVRIVTERNQHVARIDYEDDRDAGPEAERAVIDRIRDLGPSAKALLVSDYLKGTVTKAAMQSLVAIKTAGVPLLVDPKIPHLDCYAGATLVTPNHHEAEAATQRRIRNDEEAREAARDFRIRAQAGSALITRGEQGMWLSSDEAEGAIASLLRSPPARRSSKPPSSPIMPLASSSASSARRRSRATSSSHNLQFTIDKLQRVGRLQRAISRLAL